MSDGHLKQKLLWDEGCRYARFSNRRVGRVGRLQRHWRVIGLVFTIFQTGCIDFVAAQKVFLTMSAKMNMDQKE